MKKFEHVIKHDNEDAADEDKKEGLDDPFKELARGDASIGFVKMENGKVAGIDIYVVPREIFDSLPEWETTDAYQTLCEAHRCIPVDTIIEIKED